MDYKEEKQFKLKYIIHKNFICNNYKNSKDNKRLSEYSNNDNNKLNHYLLFINVILKNNFQEYFKINKNFNLIFKKDCFISQTTIINKNIEIKHIENTHIKLDELNIENYDYKLLIPNNWKNFRLKFEIIFNKKS